MSMICFDLEGPLSPQDNAYEVMGLVEDGHRLFEVISRYDDLVTLEGREGYEPGDTLALIAPFLVYHGISEEDIRRVSETAYLVDGTRDLIARLREMGWQVRIISTSYEQHAHHIGGKLGVGPEDIACTGFPLDGYRERLGEQDFSAIAEVEPKILELADSMDDDAIKPLLDGFFFENLPGTPLGDVITGMRVCGGQRKVDALERFATAAGTDIKDIVAVGDSITDFKMLAHVHGNGGLSVAFNANRYAIPYATIGLATTDMGHLSTVLDAMVEGGREGALEAAAGLERGAEAGSWPRYHILCDRDDFEDVLPVHEEARGIVRGRAAKLG